MSGAFPGQQFNNLSPFFKEKKIPLSKNCFDLLYHEADKD